MGLEEIGTEDAARTCKARELLAEPSSRSDAEQELPRTPTAHSLSSAPSTGGLTSHGQWGALRISQKQRGWVGGLSHLPPLQETPQEAHPLHRRVIEKPRVRYSVNVQSLMDSDWVPRKV